MPVTRTTLLSGPAAATFNGHTFFAYDGILVTPALEVEAVDSDAQGVLDGTVSGSPVTIRFTPSAPLGDLLALYPWTMGSPGVSLFGAGDAPLVLVAANGVRVTFAAAAVVAMPELTLTNRGPVAGAVTFLALGSRSLAVGASNRWVTVDTGTFPTAPTGTPQLADDFAVTWGGAPWVKLRARDGVRIGFALKTRPVMSDANALLDLTLEELAVEARFVPATAGGPAESDVMSALGLEGGLPGRSLAATGNTLDVAGEHLFVRLPLAALTRGELAFDAAHPRVGELVFRAERAFLGTWWHGCLFLPEQPAGTTGLARRLDPRAFYLAMRWDYGVYPKEVLRNAVVRLSNMANGRHLFARPVDFGPGDGSVIDGRATPDTGRIADLSPGAAGALGLRTDEVVRCELAG